MLEKIKISLFRLILKKYALGWLVKLYEKTTGYKTQICVALMVVTWLGETWAGLPPDLADKIYKYLEAGVGFSLLQKLKRAQPFVEEMAKEVKK